MEKSTRAAIAGLNLAKGKKVNFQFNLPERDDRTQERVRELSRRWAVEHGLEPGSFGY